MKHYKHSYAELAKIGRRYYNDTNFCGVVAVAVTCRLSFGKARSLYQQQGRKHGRGVTVRLMNKIIESVGRSTDLVKTELNGRTMNTVLRQCHTWQGDYIVILTDHVASIRDGICEDWTATGSRKKIYGILKVS